MTTEYVMGIDLGTTYSCVGVWQHDGVQIVSNDQGNRTTPSWVAFTENERLIGEAAKNQISQNPTNTIFDAKRFIGRAYGDPVLKKDLEHVSYKVVEKNGKIHFEVVFKEETKVFSPEEVSAFILGKMKEIAEAFVGETITKAVVTVPAYFNDAQRHATKDAGQIAGLQVLRIINEPTAAAIAYGLDRKTEKEQNVLVFDCGGGTHDISILNISDGIFEVKATCGDTHLGGEDIDQTLVQYCIQEFLKKHKGKDEIVNDIRAKRRLHTVCEKAKRTLSSSTVAMIEVDSLYDGIDFATSLSRAKFEELNHTFFKKVMEPVYTCLKDARLGKGDIDEIVLVGGTTRIPKIQSLLKDFFGKDPFTSINPDECVAYGATVQAAILAGIQSSSTDDVLLLDVTPLSLGIETSGEIMTVLIPRGTTIPTQKEQIFSTHYDNQEKATIKILEGERAKSAENHLLGEFLLEGIPPMTRGEPKILVKYDVSADGILEVTAEVENTEGTKKSLTITSDDQRLSKDDIERMIREAEEYKEQDAEWKAVRETKDNYQNMLDHFQYQESDPPSVKELIEEEKQWLHSSSATSEEYKDRVQEFFKKVHDLRSTTNEENTQELNEENTQALNEDNTQELNEDNTQALSEEKKQEFSEENKEALSEEKNED